MYKPENQQSDLLSVFVDVVEVWVLTREYFDFESVRI